MRQPRADEKRVIAWTLGSADEIKPLRRDAGIVLLLVALAACSFFVTATVVERVGLSLLGASALARLLYVVRAHRRRARAHESIRVDARGVSRSGQGARLLADWSKPFGLTLLARADRARGLLVFTTPEQTRYVPVSFEEGAGPSLARLLGMATPLSDGDVAGGIDDEDALSAESALALVDEIERRSPGAGQRFYLSGTHGEAIVLEAEELRVGARVFDLAAALEWRGFTFHESSGHTATVYQATWVRQGGMEAVLVAPLPADLAGVSVSEATNDASRRSRLRDLRIQQAAPGTPPARETRVGIERLFMLPLRRALDGAPRASRTGGLPPKMQSGHTGGAASGA